MHIYQCKLTLCTCIHTYRIYKYSAVLQFVSPFLGFVYIILSMFVCKYYAIMGVKHTYVCA